MNTWLCRSSLFLLICWSQVSRAQLLPYTWLYDDSKVYRIDITIDPDDLETIYDELENEIYFPCTFVYSDGLNADTLENTGFRLRGNTSLYSAKKSFKISFNAFESGRKYEGVEKLNLLGMHNDPSMVRERLYFDAYTRAGLPEHRSNFVRVYINGDYYGLYTNMEHIDEVFVQNRFGNNNGNLYKCTWPADMQWRGTNPAEYINNGYELHINEEDPNISRLVELLEIINLTDEEAFSCELEEVFNVPLFLKTYALDIATGHWDNYAGNINNFYLYENSLTGRTEFLSFDADNTFGVDWLGFDWAERDVYHWPTGWYDVPLAERLLESERYRAQFSYFLQQWHETLLHPDSVSIRVLAWRELIADAALEDLYRTYDYGYTYDDFLASFTTNNLDGHTPYGIVPFSETRNAVSMAQLDDIQSSPIIWQTAWSPLLPLPGNAALFTVLVEDPNALSSVVLHYYADGGGSNELTLYDDGSHGDLLANDGTYSNNLDIPLGTTVLSWQVWAEDIEGNTSAFPPCNYRDLVLIYNPPSLVINEVMAQNTATIANETGSYSDYIELYHAGTTTLSLYGYYLSDDPAEPFKWRIPNTTLAPDSYLLIWADDQPWLGDLHANFKLSADGETIGIYAPDAFYFAGVDTTSFPSLNPDQSFGRYPNGTGPFQYLDQPSPGANNNLLPEDSVFIEPPKPYLSNNPSPGISTLHFEALGQVYYEVWMSDALGRNLGRLYADTPAAGDIRVSINTVNLGQGPYYLRLLTASSSQTFVLIVP